MSKELAIVEHGYYYQSGTNFLPPVLLNSVFKTALTVAAKSLSTVATSSKELLNSIFISTLNTAAKSLVSVASETRAHGGKRWGITDHFRYVVMMSTWMAVWGFRVVMDYFPISLAPSQPRVLLLQGLTSSTLDLPPKPALELALDGGDVFFPDEFDPSARGIGKAMTHILALINEIPVSSRKYQIAVSMADQIVEDNSRSTDSQILLVNRIALSAAFSRTSALLLSSLRSAADASSAAKDDGLTHRVIRSLPLGTYLSTSLKGVKYCAKLMFPNLTAGLGGLFNLEKKQFYPPALTAAVDQNGVDEEAVEEVLAEKYAQEMMWIVNKMRICHDVDDVILQWSLAPGLASLALTANPRVQAFLIRITGLLIGEGAGGTYVFSREVKLRLLMLWLPLLCFGGNGLAYPVLSGYDKMELEKSIEDLISSLPLPDQELVLVNWLQDYISSSSDWPNLQNAYDAWYRSSRKLLITAA